MSTTLLILDALPPRTGVAALVRFVCDTAGVDSQRLGKINLAGRRATVEVPAEWAARLVRLLDGARFNESNIRARADAAKDATAKQRTGGEDHFARLARLLKMESTAAAEQARENAARRSGEAAERTGESIVGLVVRDEEAGLGGRALVTLGKRDTSRRLPWTKLGVGSPVLLSEENAKDATAWRGVIADRSSNVVQVALADFPELSDERAMLRIDASVDEIARQRQLDAMSRAASARGERLADLTRVLLGDKQPEFRDATKTDADANRKVAAQLNESQCEAIELALAAEDVAIIHGPPGTGKTTTVAELIRQAVARGQKVLACAPSNLAVDNVFERLLAAGVKAVRLGHPARVLPQLRAHTLDLLVDEHEDVRLARKLVRQSRSLFDKAGRYTRAKPEPGARREMRDEARALLADARRLEAQTVEQILNQADVLCATLTGLDSEILGRRRFDLAVIDEACQSVEPSCWIPLQRAERLVLAGDHCQLPPTIVSPEANREGLGVSMLERMVEMHGGTITRRLDVQYRMHAAIMDFSSEEFYEGTLLADDAVRGHLLAELPGVETSDLTTNPVEFIDTAGASYDETQEEDGASRYNREEARLVVRRVEALRAAGVAAKDIAVISPYAAQVRLLREMVDAAFNSSREDADAIEVDSVDGFQGREKEAVVISLVRSNGTGDIGFLADTRRMNVALTRARRKLIVIGDSATIGGHPFYARFLEYIERIGAYRTVWEEM